MIKGEGMKNEGLKLLKNDTFKVLSLDIFLLVSECSLLCKRLMLKETSC